MSAIIHQSVPSTTSTKKSVVKAAKGGDKDVVHNHTPAGGAVGAESLDLTIAHLRTYMDGNVLDSLDGQSHLRTESSAWVDYDDSIPFDEPSLLAYQPLDAIGVDLKEWYCSKDYQSTINPIVAKIQPFHAGGYEVTMSIVDMQKFIRNMDTPPSTGKREPREMDENNLAFSASRSKKKVRYLIASLGCDRLLTLTRRETTDFWTVEDWLKAWQRFRQMAVRSGNPFNYVLVLERHKKGNYHAHAAVAGHVKVKPLRHLWWLCCGGRGQGNIDIQYKPNMTGYKRRQGVSRYVSKYITKQLGQTEFNKKRYWATKHALPPARRVVLTAKDVRAALIELAHLLGLKADVLQSSAFIFPNESGAWFSYDTSLDEPPPF